MTYYGTGCIFHYDDEFTENSGKGFTEADTPNFTGSYYSYTKAMVESLLKEYPNVLTLRVRMPIVADLVYPRNFITKIIKYDKVIIFWCCGFWVVVLLWFLSIYTIYLPPNINLYKLHLFYLHSQ